MGRRRWAAANEGPCPESENQMEEAMRSLICATVALVVTAATAPAHAGEIHVIENGAGKKASAVKKETPALAAVPAMPDGKKNQGFNYAMLYDLPGAATHVMRGHVDAKGTIAVQQ